MLEKIPLKNTFKTKEGKDFEIPLQGSLGLLALGDIGLLAWRQKIAESANNPIKGQDKNLK